MTNNLTIMHLSTINRILALMAFLTLSAWPHALSTPLRISIDGCQKSANHSKQLACVLMLHESLCYESVMTGAMDLTDDRNQCTEEKDNPILKDYLDKTLLEIKGNTALQQQLQTAYAQWQHNIQNLKPQPLEPEYQYKIRRSTDHQALVFKLMTIQAKE